MKANPCVYNPAPSASPRPVDPRRPPALPVDTPRSLCCESRRSLGGRGGHSYTPTKAQHVLGEGGIFYVTEEKKNYERKEISMQNDEHGPVDSSRLCFVGSFSVIPWFRALIFLLRISLLSPSLSPPQSVCLRLCLRPSASLPSPAPAACPRRIDRRWRLHPGLVLRRPRPARLGRRRPGRAAPPRSCSLGSGDAPCMSPHPWIVTTRNNRNKVNKSENK